MAAEAGAKTVLLVDDDRDILAAMTAALDELGPEILTAENGDEALIQAQQHSPDVVVLDMMLPKRSGFLVLEQLKRGKKPTDPPQVVMITGNQGSRHRVYAENLGVAAYINKPFRMEKLVETVKGLLA
jgi:DNA-binding response OmpR family regulator